VTVVDEKVTVNDEKVTVVDESDSEDGAKIFPQTAVKLCK
jgi:hypothetical protein